MKFYMRGALGLVLALSGCLSDQPTQKPNKSTVVQNPASPSRPVEVDSQSGKVISAFGVQSKNGVYILDHVIGRKPTEIRDPRQKGNEEDDRIEKNAKQPIEFNGVDSFKTKLAGINFETSHVEASKVLSKPIVGACGSSGDYYYENLCLLWSDEEPRYLRRALILDGYLGEIEFADPIGKVTLKAELKYAFTEEMGPRGEEILRRTYNKFFQKEDSYDCLEAKDCQAVFYNDYINWLMPNLTVVFSKDRKVLVQLSINQDVNPEELAGPMDLLQGKILLGEGKEIALGDSWSSVQAKLSQKHYPRSILEPTSYRQDFVGMVARIQRKGAFFDVEQFDPKQTEPMGEEPLTNVVSYANNTSPILIGGKYVKVEVLSEEEVQVVLQETVPEKKHQLTVRMPQLANNVKLQKNFLIQLGELLKQGHTQAVSAPYVSQRFAGFNAKHAPNRSLVMRTSLYDGTSNKDRFIYVSVSVGTGNLVFGITQDQNPVAPQVLKTVNRPVVLKAPDLSGFKLSDKVTLSKMDRNRNEGFLSIGDKNLRVEFDLHASFKVSYARHEVIRQNVVEVSGLSGVTIGVAPQGLIGQDTKELAGEVVYISSTLNPNGVSGLCGTDHLFKTGISQRKFGAEFRQIIKTAALQSDKFSCDVFTQSDESGDGQTRVYFFPGKGVGSKVFFGERALIGVAKYKLPEGGL